MIGLPARCQRVDVLHDRQGDAKRAFRTECFAGTWADRASRLERVEGHHKRRGVGLPNAEKKSLKVNDSMPVPKVRQSTVFRANCCRSSRTAGTG